MSLHPTILRTDTDPHIFFNRSKSMLTKKNQLEKSEAHFLELAENNDVGFKLKKYHSKKSIKIPGRSFHREKMNTVCYDKLGMPSFRDKSVKTNSTSAILKKTGNLKPKNLVKIKL